MASPSQNFTFRLYHAAPPPLAASTALATWALAAATFFAIGTALGGGLAASAAALVIGLVVVPLGVLRLHGVGVASLGLARPRAREIAGAALAGACTWYVTLRVALPIVAATGRDAEVRDFTRAVTGDGAALPWVLAASALAPGVCEELLHRGVVLPALARRAGPGVGLVAVTALFAVMHIEPARIATAALIGLAAGSLTLWTRSLWPAITLHIINNVAALLVGTGHLPGATRFVTGHPDAALSFAVAGTLCGLALAAISPKPARPPGG